MSQFEEVIRHLGSKTVHGYGLTAIPSPIDNSVRTLLDYLSHTDDPAAGAILSAMAQQHGFVLATFANRMAAYAVRTGQEEYLREALVALGWASYLVDYREVVPILSLAYRSAEKIGSDPAVLFTTPTRGTETFRSEYEHFPLRSEEDRSIEAMWYIESADQDGFRYQRKW